MCADFIERLAKAKSRIFDNLYIYDANSDSYILLSDIINDRIFQAEGKHVTELYNQLYYLYSEYGDYWDYYPVNKATVESLKEIENQLDEFEKFRKKYVYLKRQLIEKMESFKVSYGEEKNQQK